MADPPTVPPADPTMPAPLVLSPNQPTPQDPAAPQTHIGQQPALNWSHFRPEFTGKPEEDVEAYLLHTNGWMNTHKFPDVKVQRFCLILVGKARLLYGSLRPIANDWQALQEQFRQQYSKTGNTREQLFQAWRSFHYDENAEMIDAYVNHIRQVATLLGYKEPQVLEVFKNTTPNRLYWILYPIDNLKIGS